MVSCICNSIQNGRKNPMTPSNAVQYLSWSIKREKNNESCLEIGKLENGFIANKFVISRMKDWFILMETAFNLNAMNLYNIKVNCSFHTTNNLAGFSARFNCTVITQRLPNSLYNVFHLSLSILHTAWIKWCTRCLRWKHIFNIQGHILQEESFHFYFLLMSGNVCFGIRMHQPPSKKKCCFLCAFSSEDQYKQLNIR